MCSMRRALASLRALSKAAPSRWDAAFLVTPPARKNAAIGNKSASARASVISVFLERMSDPFLWQALLLVLARRIDAFRGASIASLPRTRRIHGKCDLLIERNAGSICAQGI